MVDSNQAHLTKEGDSMRGNTFFTIHLLAALSAVLLIIGCGSSSSDSAPPDTTVPSAPTSLTAVAASSTKVSLRWAASTDNVGVTEYAINRNGALLATTGTATTAYSDTSCTASTMYSYSVTALDAAGNVSTPSATKTTTTIVAGLADGTPPSAPPTLTASALSSSQISLSWSAATDTVGVSGYYIYRAASQSSTPSRIGISTTTSYVDTGLAALTAYYYVVTAFDGVPNESVNSQQATATTQ
jgi:cellulose 1,4-beta-cellobiosidase